MTTDEQVYPPLVLTKENIEILAADLCNEMPEFWHTQIGQLAIQAAAAIQLAPLLETLAREKLEAQQRVAELESDALAPAAADPPPPFPNCRFRICDLPGQCVAEGKCHHPAAQPVPDTVSRADVIAAIEHEAAGWEKENQTVLANAVHALIPTIKLLGRVAPADTVSVPRDHWADMHRDRYATAQSERAIIERTYREAGKLLRDAGFLQSADNMDRQADSFAPEGKL